jgi:FAD-dependent urate hydroxylase
MRVVESTSLLVIGAGPYGLAVAAQARERGIDAIVVGHPLGFWTDHMPAGMYLRSGIDWHLDGSDVHTFEAFVEDRGFRPAELNPIPISIFLEYARWFQNQKALVVRDQLVLDLDRRNSRFVAEMEDGTRIVAEHVVAAPGCGYFAQIPDWAAELPRGTGSHTSDVVEFGEFAGQHVLIVGGRQSAYEWAALLGEHGAKRVDIVHRHDVPRFGRVSWSFVDDYMDATIQTPGWWRSLSQTDRDQVTRQFWEAGRLTLEWWLKPRLSGDRFHVWPRAQLASTTSELKAAVMTLSNGERLHVDRVIFATGYTANLSNVPYLRSVLPTMDIVDGFPSLDPGFQSSVPGLYFPGFTASRDFGPFFGFTRACPVAAKLIVDSLEHQSGDHSPVRR